jgi:hypothetical protein
MLCTPHLVDYEPYICLIQHDARDSLHFILCATYFMLLYKPWQATYTMYYVLFLTNLRSMLTTSAVSQPCTSTLFPKFVFTVCFQTSTSKCDFKLCVEGLTSKFALQLRFPNCRSNYAFQLCVPNLCTTLRSKFVYERYDCSVCLPTMNSKFAPHETLHIMSEFALRVCFHNLLSCDAFRSCDSAFLNCIVALLS